jgi:PEP-CTERM motif
MRRSLFSSTHACAVAALFAAAFAAHAEPVSLTLTDWAFDAGNNVNLSNSSNSISYTGRAGAFKGTLSNSGFADSNFFTTYCIELEQSFKFGPTAMSGYSVTEGASYFADRRSNSAIADKLGRLMTYIAADPTRVDTSIESTSLQLAVWNLVYDNDYSLSTGNFRDGSSYAAGANQLMAGANGVVTSKFDVYALTNANTQDFLLLSAKAPGVVKTSGGDGDRPPTTNAVPEPGTIALSGLALLVLAGTAALRRRQTRA